MRTWPCVMRAVVVECWCVSEFVVHGMSDGVCWWLHALVVEYMGVYAL